MYEFHDGAALLELCASEGIPISKAMLLREEALSETSSEALLREMRENLTTMKQAVERGLSGSVRSLSGLSGGEASRLYEYSKAAPLLGSEACAAAAASMAVVEVNAAMGRIVASPTAGACGILPGVLLTLAPKRGWSDEALVQALFCAGAIGLLIARHASISGADAGCQAETGSAASMAAAAVVELSSGTPQMCLHAAAIALKNVLGLVCDPVCGLVESPCIKRNALGAVNALLAADLALSGVKSLIPFDEVVEAMRSVGVLMRPELRETALGGLAATPTAKRLTNTLFAKRENPYIKG